MRAGSSGTRRVLVQVFLLSGPLVLVLQLLVGVKVPGSTPSGSSVDGFSFTIISIESGRSGNEGTYPWGAESGGPELWDVEMGPRGVSDPDGYEDENEMTTRQGGARKQVELQPWVAGQSSFTSEAERFITYITSPQVQCSQILVPGESKDENSPVGPWALCLEGWALPASTSQPCLSYSFSLDQKDKAFVKRMLLAGCEVHQFNPGRKQSPGTGPVQLHHTWLDWRRPRRRKQTGLRDAMPQTLSAIMDLLGHTEVHFINANLEGAEWRVLESWLADGCLRRIRQLVLTVHLQWAGFEVAGSDAEVVRFWYSVTCGLHAAGFRLLHSREGAGQTVLRHELPNARSTYTLTWVKTLGRL